MGRGRHRRPMSRRAVRIRSAAVGFAIIAVCAGTIFAVEAQHDRWNQSQVATAPSTTIAATATTNTPPGSTSVTEVTEHSTSTVTPPTTPPGTSEPVDASTASALPDLTGKTIVIDPGHNGGNGSHTAEINRLVEAGGFTKACDTTGTQTNDGYPEHAFTFDVSQRLATILRDAGATVVLTRTDDTGVGPCVNERAGIGNTNHADVAVSVHADGGGPGGRGFHILPPGGCSGCENSIVEPSGVLGRLLRDAFRDHTDMPVSNYLGVDGIAVRTDLGGLNLSNVPKVFVECGNMRNATDAAMLRDPAFRQQAAEAIAIGLGQFLAP